MDGVQLNQGLPPDGGMQLTLGAFLDMEVYIIVKSGLTVPPPEYLFAKSPSTDVAPASSFVKLPDEVISLVGPDTPEQWLKVEPAIQSDVLDDIPRGQHTYPLGLGGISRQSSVF